MKDRVLANEKVWEDLCKSVPIMEMVISNPYLMTPGVVTPSDVKDGAPIASKKWNHHF